jgi:RNA polymerase sigma-70 factor (subfamily 1)
MHTEPKQLLPGVSRGGALLLDDILAAHLPALRAYVCANLGPLLTGKESASDLVQSACREVLQHLDRFRHDGEAGFKRWLYATALRKIQDRHRFFRAEKRDAGREADPEAAGALAEALFRESATPSHAAARREEVERVHRVLETLPPNYREVIRLAHLEGLLHKALAARLSISEANARMLLSRALARLARQLEV